MWQKSSKCSSFDFSTCEKIDTLCCKALWVLIYLLSSVSLEAEVGGQRSRHVHDAMFGVEGLYSGIVYYKVYYKNILLSW